MHVSVSENIAHLPPAFSIRRAYSSTFMFNTFSTVSIGK